MANSATHPTVSLVLDIVDIVVKVAAVGIGASWTWWNYRKSRTYAQKLELEVVGTIFTRTHPAAGSNVYGDIIVSVKNIGATKHSVEQAGTFCELIFVHDDLSEKSIGLFRVFEHNHNIEPEEAMNDAVYWHYPHPIQDVLWVKLTLRIVSNGVEWLRTSLVRVETELDAVSSEVI